MSQPAGVITSNRYALVIDGHEIAVFSELSGIIAEIEPSEYWEASGEAINGPLTASRWRPGLG